MDALGITPTLLIAQIVNFGILVFLLRQFLYTPILNMLAQRKEKIAQSMKDAERVNAAAREAEAGKREAEERALRAERELEELKRRFKEL